MIASVYHYIDVKICVAFRIYERICLRTIFFTNRDGKFVSNVFKSVSIYF